MCAIVWRFILTYHSGFAAVANGEVVEHAGEVVSRPAKFQVFHRHDVAGERGVHDPEDGFLFGFDGVGAGALDNHRS